MIYFGGLHWRSVGTLGHGSFSTLENDTGPDDCNHGEMGIALYYDPLEMKRPSVLKNAQLMDLTPTCSSVSLDVPPTVHGTPLWTRAGIQ